MNPKLKTLLGILIAVLLTGIGYFGVFKAKRSVETINQPPVNTPPKTEEIVTFDWQTFRNETLGFEIKMPKEWVVKQEYLGRFDPDDDEFWQDQVGGARFIASMTNGFPQFNVRVKDSNLILNDFFGDSWKEYTVNGLQSKKSIHDARPRGSQDYQERILIKNENRYYYFEFFAGITDIPADIKIWNAIISTFEPTS